MDRESYMKIAFALRGIKTALEDMTKAIKEQLHGLHHGHIGKQETGVSGDTTRTEGPQDTMDNAKGCNCPAYFVKKDKSTQ